MRNYIVASWNDADQYDYSGEMLGGSRHQGRSQKVHFNPDGSACVASYGDDEPKTSKVSIKDKILPQFKRLQTLQSQMVDLEKEYKTTDMSISEYSVLRDIIVAKIQRQEVLYKRAVSVKPIRTDEDTLDYQDETPEDSAETTYTINDQHTPVAPSCGVIWIDDLSPSNSFKSFLKMSCKVMKISIEWHNRTKAYIQTLKEV